MQGKFWAEGSESSSVDSSDDGSQSESEVETHIQAVRRRQKETTNVSSRWAIDSDSDSSEDDRRVVRGAKEKFHDELRGIIRRVNNHVKVLDFTSLNEEYDKLLKCMQKSQSVVAEHGIPNFFIASLVELESFLDEKFKDKEGIKRLSKAKATSFNTLRAKFRKSAEEYKKQVDDCKNNPELYQNDSLSDGSYSYSDSDADSGSASDSDSSLSSSSDNGDERVSGSSSSSSDWSSYEEEYEDRHASALAKWGTRTKSTKKEGTGRKSRQKSAKKEAQHDTVSVSFVSQGAAGSTGGGGNNADLLSFEGEITVDMIVEKVGEIVAARGKKGTDRQEQIRLLKRAAEISKPLSIQAYADVLTHLISAQFDTITGAFHCITCGIWSEICENINILLDLVLNHKEKRVYISGFQSFISLKDRRRKVSGDNALNNAGPTNGANVGGSSSTAPEATDVAPEGSHASNQEEQGQTASNSNAFGDDIIDPKEQDKSTVTFLVSFIERLDGESLKALQLTDVHSSEYKDRLVQSLHLLALLWRCYKICEERGYLDLVSTLSVHLINQLHFKDDSLAFKVWEFVKQILAKTVDSSALDKGSAAKSESSLGGNVPDVPVPNIKPSELITRLVQNVYKHGDQKDKLKVLIQHVYNMALHDNYYEAVNLFQSIGVYDMALGSDVAIQILYNRSLVQLGLSAFRLGLIAESQQLLCEICMPNRNRELLAQGLSNMKSQERTPEQERAEKRRLLPYHMHLSLEVIDCIYLICSMLLEVPYMAYHRSVLLQNEGVSPTKFRPISKQFRRLLEQYERQAITGPPESLRDTIIAATRSLQLGKWKECRDYIFSLSIWDNSMDKKTALVQSRLEFNIKQEALRTYLYTYGRLYTSFSVEGLINMFQLPRTKINSMLSKMMLRGELHALWDQTGEYVILNNKQASKIQSDSLIVADKLLQLVECNESVISSKSVGGGAGGKGGLDGLGEDSREVRGGKHGAGGRGGVGMGHNSAGSMILGNVSGSGGGGGSATGGQSYSNHYSRKTGLGQHGKHKGSGLSSAGPKSIRI